MDEHDLFLAWSSGAADEAAIAVLDLRLRDDPACAHRFAAFCVEETALAAAARAQVAPSAKRTPATRPSRVRRTTARRSWTRAATFAALAASIAITVAVIRHPRPAPPATVVACHGDARVAGHAARVGDAIADGDALATGADGRLALALSEGTRITLSAASEARFVARAGRGDRPPRPDRRHRHRPGARRGRCRGRAPRGG